MYPIVVGQVSDIGHQEARTRIWDTDMTWTQDMAIFKTRTQGQHDISIHIISKSAYLHTCIDMSIQKSRHI